MIQHKIALSMDERPARIEIDKDRLVVEGGGWPDFGGVVVMLPSVTLDLEAEDRFVYADREGGIVVSDGFIGYGLEAANQQAPMLDLLAWKEDDDWNVKEMVNG
jgi:hypothetical protein